MARLFPISGALGLASSGVLVSLLSASLALGQNEEALSPEASDPPTRPAEPAPGEGEGEETGPPEPAPRPIAAPPSSDEVAQPQETEAPPSSEPPVAEDEEPTFEATAEVEAPPREPTKRALSEEQLTVIPGTRGDALRAIEVMPGVGRTQFGVNPGPPILRGSPSSESLALIDGAPVPILYHFGGLTSVFSSHLLETVNLYPGNYSARFGRAAGGVVEARVRDPKSDKFHAMLELSAIDSSALVEAPLGNRTSVALAARRSNVDLFFESLLPDDTATVIAAPVYWDYQAILSHRISDSTKLLILGFGASDAMELYLGNSAPDDPSLQGGLSAETSFHRVQVELVSEFSEVVKQELMVATGPSPGEGSFGALTFDYRSMDVSARASWSIFASSWLRLDTGLDFQMNAWDATYSGPPPAPDDGTPPSGSMASETNLDFEITGAPVRPAAYVEASVSPTESLHLIPGVRADYNSDGGDWTVDPRFAARFKLAAASTVKGGIGYYSQPPQYWELMEEFGNPDLEPYRTLQTSLGYEHLFGERLTADIEGFYKHWEDRIVGTAGGAPPRYENGGTGDAYGMELLLTAKLSAKSQAFAAYTLSRSVRKDRPEEEERLFDDDQTHNLSLTANYDLGKNWLVGARFRYVTGNPYSEVQAAVYDANSDTYRPIYGGVNEARHPAFHQLDIRAEKMWQLGPVGLTAFLEVMNVYNASNLEGRGYSFDYRKSTGVTGMPLFPNLGIRGEL